MTAKSHDDNGKDEVLIKMDDTDHPIHRGHETVKAIKALCGVSPADVIEQIGANGTLTLLDDNGAVIVSPA